FATSILDINYNVEDRSVLSRETLKANLAKHGIEGYSESDFNDLVKSISDEYGNITNLHRYYGGHVYSMYRPDSELMKQVVVKLGGLNEEDLKHAKLFVARIKRISDVAREKNCKLYVDAEQTYIQAAIESFGQQMTHQLNRDKRVVVMNGY
ncbi:MAG: hypothetical protein ACKO8H_17785, partial [Microcystis panniformis]